MSEPTKRETVLPYNLGGRDDPFFEGEGVPPFREDLSADSPIKPEMGSDQRTSDGALSLDKTEETTAWYDRQDWDEPGNGGANDHLWTEPEDE